MRKIFNAFTLAEVLITLVIIGIIAAITVPTIMIKKDKEQTCTKLKKFYSTMTSAIMLYKNAEGITNGKLDFPEEIVNNGEQGMKWYQKTIGKYISSTLVKQSDNEHWQVFLNDGSSFVAYSNGIERIHIFYCTKPSCSKEDFQEEYDGKRTFLFTLYNSGTFVTSYGGKTIFPREDLLNKCKNTEKQYCTKLIQVDGWQIKDDYPW